MDIVTNGHIRPSEVVSAVDGLMYKMKKKGLWESLDFMIRIWSERNPEVTKQFLKEQHMIKTTRKKHAAFSNKTNRLLVSLPAEIHHFLTVFWDTEIQNMGTKRFYREVARRYPFFKIPEGNI